MNSDLVSNDMSAGTGTNSRADIEAAGMTSIGLERSTNEDAYLIAML